MACGFVCLSNKTSRSHRLVEAKFTSSDCCHYPSSSGIFCWFVTFFSLALSLVILFSNSLHFISYFSHFTSFCCLTWISLLLCCFPFFMTPTPCHFPYLPCLPSSVIFCCSFSLFLLVILYIYTNRRYVMIYIFWFSFSHTFSSSLLEENV